jgi:murein DD-endopeptidase MepM/ murein hydrolase activator NlpD
MPVAPQSFAPPYTEYWITQGLHGFSYGHMAIDIAAGEGEPVLSPIAGQVTRKNTDGYGNPVLVIENEVYRVTLLHGIYSVEVGEVVNQGSVVGEESNIGYTTDMQGRLCAGRDCGFHTHLNVFDKRVGGNVNPLDLLE